MSGLPVSSTPFKEKQTDRCSIPNFHEHSRTLVSSIYHHHIKNLMILGDFISTVTQTTT